MNRKRFLLSACFCCLCAAKGVSAQEQATFTQRAAQVGDRVAQTVSADLQVNTTITQAGQAASENQATLKRRQQKFIEVLEVTDGQVRRAHVSFPIARTTSPSGENPQAEIVQPIEKKSYLVTRKGKQLFVTDAAGVIPPKREFELVVTSLQHLGLPNPLLQFLLGRTIHVGERLQLPQKIAEELMGFGDQFGQVKLFELELKSIQQIDQEPCAIFSATIEADGAVDNPVRIRAFGQVVIQTKTCRTVRAELSGPMTLSTVEHTPAGSFQYRAQGSLQIAVKSQYGQARQ